MASDNLIPFNERSEEEARELGRKGGKASGEARRQKKAMREMLEMCLEMKNQKGQSYRELATLGLLKGAMKGNAQNYRTILETLGELKPEEANKNIIEDLTPLAELLKGEKK